MTNDEIVEGNKVIVTFLGAKFEYYTLDRNDRTKTLAFIDQTSCPPLKYMWRCSLTPENPFSWSYPQNLNYSTNWNSLMKVVAKIEDIKDSYHGHFGVHIVSNSCTIQATNFRSDQRIPDSPYYFNNVVMPTKIEAVWIAVVNFINWYNKQ